MILYINNLVFSYSINPVFVFPSSCLLLFSFPPANFELLVATQSGVIARGLGVDDSPRCVDSTSRSSIGVAFDAHTATTYWVTDGSIGRVVSLAVGGASVRTPEVVNAFSLRLDWVTRRLFWVQNGAQDAAVLLS